MRSHDTRNCKRFFLPLKNIEALLKRKGKKFTCENVKEFLERMLKAPINEGMLDVYLDAYYDDKEVVIDLNVIRKVD